MPSTSGCFASPTIIILYPSLYFSSTIWCIFETNGHVASTIFTFLALRWSITSFDTPCERIITVVSVPSSILSVSSITYTPAFSISDTTCSLWITGPNVYTFLSVLSALAASLYTISTAL